MTTEGDGRPAPGASPGSPREGGVSSPPDAEPAGSRAPELAAETGDPRDHAAPADPRGDAAPADPRGDAAPADPRGDAAPADPRGDAAPDDPRGDAAPDAPRGDAAPDAPRGDAAPDDPRGDAAPDDPGAVADLSAPPGAPAPAPPPASAAPDEPRREAPAPADPPDAWDRVVAALAARGAAPAAGLLAVIAALLYSGVFRGEVVGDDLTFHMAEARRLADCLRAGDWDFWSPSANGGFASLYYYQSIPQLAAAIPAAIFGHFVFWFQLSVFLPHALTPLAAYRGARLLGASPWEAVGAAFAVTLISGASRWGTGADGTFQVGLYTQTWALAAFPLALGHGARWIGAARGLAPGIAWGALVTMCHPFAGISLGIVLVVGVAHRVVAAAVARARLTQAAIAALAVGCLVGAAAHAVLLVARWQLLYVVPLSLLAAAGARLAWRRWRERTPPPPPGWGGEVLRVAVLGVAMLAAAAPVWLTVVVDYEGFGGFPHRVADEVGPGYLELMRWQLRASILDHQRPAVLTWLLPAVALLSRGAYLRWLWLPALVFAALLAAGPHVPKTADDLLPAVRFLGAMQVVLALAVGAGAVGIGRRLWHAPDGSGAARALRYGVAAGLAALAGAVAASFVVAGAAGLPLRAARAITLDAVPDDALRIGGTAAAALGLALVVPAWRALAGQAGRRTAITAVAASLCLLVAVPGGRALGSRVRVLGDYPASSRPELMEVVQRLTQEPGGRKQVASGAENHWWNLLTYVYARRPSLLQMGGGGLQASPNYDFVWSVRDLAKLAWVYDAPFLAFAREHAASQPAGETVLATKRYELRRLRAPGLVSPIHVTGTLPPGRAAARRAGIEWLRGPQPLANQHLAYAGHGVPGRPPYAAVLRAGRTESPGDHGDLFAEVDATLPSTLVFRESWHPRWRAYIDGRPAPIRRVTPDFPAVDVGVGRHLLQLRFERPWWAHAAWLLWPLLAVAAWLAQRRGPQRRAGDPAP